MFLSPDSIQTHGYFAWRKVRGRRQILLAVIGGSLLALSATAHADNSLRLGARWGPGSAGSAAATSQTATAATAGTSQTVQTNVLAQHAQASLQHSVQALQALQAAQAAARTAAINGANNLGLDPNNSGQTLLDVHDGLAVGGLVPMGSTVSSSNPNAELIPVQITNSTGSQISVSQGGTVNLPNGTGNDKVTISGAGTIATSGGTIPFSGTVTEALPAGSSITLTSKGTVGYASGSDSSISATVPSDVANFVTSGVGVSNWTGIGGLSQSTSSSATPAVTVTIDQTQQQALLYWSSFNIGKNTTLSFDQSAGGANVGQWVAINKITDSSLSPSQILGSIQAPGQVYVLNQNGIIFGGSSQVNVGALTASSLALNPAYIADGLLNDAANNYQFQFSSLFTYISQPAGKHGNPPASTAVTPLWTGLPAVPASATEILLSVPTGDVTVQAGAQLSSPVNGVNQGGRIALIAPNVTNDGTISTPDGQTILAAGLQVGFAAHNANDASLRGLDVFIGQVGSVSSTIPSGTFTFNGLPNNDELTFAGTGQVGTYTAPSSTTPVPLLANTPTAIPTGSKVKLTSGTASFGAVQGGVVTNAANTLNANGNIVTPGGDIESSEAGVILTGQTVNQLGVINASTSVTLNGRIDLLADYNAAVELSGGVDTFYPFSTGTVNMGAQSVTQILPELSSTATTIGTQLAFSSLINIQGLNIEMFPGSLLLAPGASEPSAGSSPALDFVGAQLTSGVTMNAGSWFTIGSTAGSEKSVFSNNNGQITLDPGSVIDVSGSENVSASVAEDIIPVQLRGPELADSPLQQNGALRGDTVYIDIRNVGVYNGTPWVGTPLGDVSGYVNNIGRTVGELTTNGGTVALNAGNSVTVDGAAAVNVNGTTVNEPGASINVSGGWINYAGANVQTTQVVSNGQLLNIAQATPNLVYQGIYTGFTQTSTKWGVSQNFGGSLLAGSQYDPGYIQGGGGGALAMTAPAMTLDGNFYGNTVAGSLQRTSSAALNSTYAGATFLPSTLEISAVPQASQLDLSFLQHTSGILSNVYLSTSPNIAFETDSYISQNTPAANQIFLSQDIVNTDGFGSLIVDTSASGTITVPQAVSLTTSPGGLISFTAANIDIEGSLAAPGGGVDGGLNFTVLDISPTTVIQLSTPPPDPTRGHFILGPDASLSSTGLMVDDRPTASAPDTLPFATRGGAISIAALNVDLAPGSSIDVSGGVAVSSSGQETYGNAGSISILGGQDSKSTSLVASGQLILGSTLTGYSGSVSGGGTLTIQAPLVQIGGSTLLNGDSSLNAMVQGEASVTGNGTTLWLDQSGGRASSGDFFSQGGFGAFTIKGLGQIETDGTGAYLFNAAGDPIVSPAVLIASGTTISPVVENFVVNFNGANIALTPLSQAQAGQLLPSQRMSVNLTFNAEGVTSTLANDGPPKADGSTDTASGSGGVLVRGDLVMQSGATIQTDPQTNSSKGVALLAAHGTVAVLGSINAPGGTITITGGNTTGLSSNQLLFYESSANQPFPTVDLGPGSVLSTAGTTEQTVNTLGYDTGSVLPGGNIVINGNIVAEQGATINVSGASAVLDQTSASLGQSAGQIGSFAPVATRIDSNGGSITLNASQLLYCDATLLGAAGGSMAQGGSLSVSSGFAVTANPSVNPPTPQDVTLIVSQQGLNGGFSLPANTPTGLAVVDGQVIPGSASALGATVNSSVPGGEPVYSYFAANPNLFVSATSDHGASNNGGQAGGFASLSLAGTLDFNGAVSITTSNSLSVALSSGNTTSGQTGGVIYANAPVVLTSPYVALNAYETSVLLDPVASTSYPAALAGTGSLTVNASTLADLGNLSLQNINTLTFNSLSTQGGDIRGVGTLQVAGRINMNAAQIYPPTESTFTIEANDVSITAPTGQALPSLPLSAGGTLNIDANSIEQAGVLRAPFGIINLGTAATQSITLAGGGITSVSGVDPATGLGITVPYGIVDDNGNWFDPQGNNITLTGPPAKAVNVTGQNVHILSGSTIDLTGGGNLFAYQFSSGTGGNKDILASTGAAFSSTSFAIIPGYSLNYAPDGTYAQNTNLQTNNVADAGYFNSNLAVGEQIYLNASSGLPAGNYTLLPARYALLPGAFLVGPASGGAPGASVMQPDGISLVSGYVTSGLNPTSSPVFRGFELSSQSLVLTRAPYTINSANTFFPQSAASNNLAVPRLPVDAGQLVLDATQTMTIQGTLLSQPGMGGLGGEVDIASPENIYIVGPNPSVNVPTADTLVLDSSQLTDFGAASLLIGGYRTTTDTGTSVTVTTNDLVVDNGGASTVVDGVTVAGLAAPDITLVSNTNLAVADGSVIEQFGSLSGKAQTLTLQGDGALLRISSDSSAQISRENVTTPDTTSVLSIGQGVKIVNANGGAVGALTLDSTSLVTIDTSTGAAPILSGTTVTLDSGFINLELSTPATAPMTGLVITEPQLQSLLASTQSLDFLSYSSIAIYGSGDIGGVTVGASGQKTYQEASLALHADDIYYADTQDSSGVTINAQTISLDNLAGGAVLPSTAGLGAGNLTINAQTITLGSNAMRMDQFDTVTLNADGAILLKGLGTQVSGSDTTPTPASLTTSGNLVLTTPLITGAAAADQAVASTTTSTMDETIDAAGTLVIQAPNNDSVAPVDSSGLAASLSLIGSSITQNSGSVVLHSGSLDLQATGAANSVNGGNIVENGTLDVSGVAQTVFNLTKYPDGGQVVLDSLHGNVAMGSSGLIDVSAASGPGTLDSGAGNGGSVTITAAGELINSNQLSLTSSGQSVLTLPQATSFIVLPSGTPGNDALSFSSGGTVTSGGVTTPFSAGSSLSSLASGSTIQLGSPGTVTFVSGGTGGAIPIILNNIRGQAGGVTQTGTGTVLAQGSGGTFTLDVGSFDASGGGVGLLSSIETGLTGFTQQTIRDRNDATVTVDDTITAGSFNLSADQGSIVVTGGINASNVSMTDPNGNPILVGGAINLEAGGSVTLASTAILNASGQNFSNAGQGGSVTLDAGSYEGTPTATSSAAINLMTGAQIDLSVDGGIGGTLHLRAPQVAGGSYVAGSSYTPVAVNAANGGSPTDVAITPISSTVVQNASSIIVEGFYVQDALQSGSVLIDNYKTTAEHNATLFMGNASTIQNRLFGSNVTNVNVQPGEEIDNSLGSLELQNTWDLSTLRYGAPLLDAQGNPVVDNAGNAILSEPGRLTVRAAGNLNIDFGASLTDGFDGSAGVSYTNVLMPIGSQSWSYNLVSGADFSAASTGAVQAPGVLQTSGLGGSLQLGYQNTDTPTQFSNPSTPPSLGGYFQTIRTGTGNITIDAGGNILLLNNLATIYTAGTQVDSTLGGTFTPPSGANGIGALPATYSMAGGNVTLSAQGNIAHEAYNGLTPGVADSSAELPTNWLDREGSVSGGIPTTWWVDFTNFVEGVGALGGGNVTLSAGDSIINVDAVVPTNARLVNGQLTELGGGDLVVRAGDNIDAGVYYVERGQGTLTAGNNIQTNSTRDATPLSQLLASTPIDWLPTTLFLGKGSFSVAAGGNLLLGPVANPFLLPQSYNNIDSTGATSELSYFSTYAATDAVNASSLAGTVTIQDFADGNGQGSLYAWYTNVLDADASSLSPGSEISDSQPWLLLAEAAKSSQPVRAYFGPAGVLQSGPPLSIFGGVTALLPPTLRVTAYSRDIDLIGSLTLSPASSGTVDLVAAGSLNAFQVNEASAIAIVGGAVSTFSGSGLVNLSDADPNALPGITSPLSSGSQLANLDNLFTTTGATEGVPLQTRQQLHADINSASLHANDPNPDPIYIFAGTGDISGLTVYSAKQAQVIAGQDISDIGLYLQNNNANDISLVDAGRDIIAYDASSPLREQAGTNLIGNDSSNDNPNGTGSGAPNSGDIQISGPGTLEVLVGRNLTLGNDAGQTPGNIVSGDGLYTGLTSVGGQLNPALPFGGANIIAATGLGDGLSTAVGLQDSSLNFFAFDTQFLNPASTYASTYLPDLASALGLSNATNTQVWDIYSGTPDTTLTTDEVNLQTSLTPALHDTYALDIFYLVLRDAGRNHNDPGSPGFGNYTAGEQALAALFPASNSYQGNINLTSREVKTSNGGDINLLVPGGQLTVGVDLSSGQAVDQGILTVDGGNISIFANSDVSLGTSRIFTLHGGNEIIWSTTGNIDAGSSSKTVVSAPPTRVVVDPTSGDVQTDLAGLSTGGGIGVLASVAGAPPGDVDLIAPLGTINAGDAGIRASGNLNIAALKVLNADNISVGGKSSGVPASASVNVGAVTAASAAAGSSEAAASGGAPGGRQDVAQDTQDLPSIITVEVLGYGGGDQD